ncbi:MAG: hypothetical protein OXF23_00040 [Candidatus Dadabacteria bacterium]|nr:hypothetical protein [Candidatus Dadabacteria bacterium]
MVKQVVLSPIYQSRNILEALSRLSSAAIDIPAAWLEGKIQEMHAEIGARVHLIKTFAEQIKHQM